MNDSLRISSDRNSIMIRLFLEGAMEINKGEQKRLRETRLGDIVEFPGAVCTPDGYYYSLKGRYTLKDFICGTGTVSIKVLQFFAESLQSLCTDCETLKIEINDFIFDYSGVLAGTEGDFFKFIYMPGLSKTVSNCGAGELLQIVILNLNELLPEDSMIKLYENTEKLYLCKTTCEIKAVLGEIIEELKLYTAGKETISEKVKALFYKKQEAEAPKEREKKISKQKNTVKFSVELKYEGDEKTVRKAVVCGETVVFKIGRDEEWSDAKITDMFASRKHAELEINDKGNIHVKNLSTNGLIINNTVCGKEENFKLGRKETVICVTNNCRLRLKKVA